MVKWRVILEAILLLSTVSVAYGSKYEIINKMVSLHFPHIITISLLTIDMEETTHAKVIQSYQRLYRYVNLTLDCCALVFTVTRWFIMDGIKVDHFVSGEPDLPLIISWAFMFLYVLHVIVFIIFDIVAIAPRDASPRPIAPVEVATAPSAAVSSFFQSGTRRGNHGLRVTIPAVKFRFNV